MKTKLTIAALIACCGVAAAQDSVSTNPDGGNGLPGDALDVFDGANARTSYVVDLANLTSSWGNEYAIGPVLKSGKASNNDPASFFNPLPGANSMSQDVLSDVGLASTSYDLWTMPGGGVNTESFSGSPLNDATLNSTLAAATIEADSFRIDQVAAHFNSFNSLTTPGDTRFNGLAAAVINYDPTVPTRLYVTRVETANNEPAFGGPDTAQFGGGGIDASGNSILRADDFGTGAGSVVGQNIFRIRNLDRTTGIVNQIALGGGADATDDLVVGSGTTHTVSAIVPQSLGTPGGAMAGTNFNGEYVFGSASPATNTTAHRGALDVATRGNVGWFGTAFAATGGVGTASQIFNRDVTLDGGIIDDLSIAIGLWGTAADGSVTGQTALVTPASISDACDPFTITDATGATGDPFGPGSGFDFWEIGGRFGATAFRGSSGVTGVGYDPDNDRGLAAAKMLNSGIIDDSANPRYAMAVASFDPANPADVNWSLAGWADFDARIGGAPDTQWGKPILDGPGGNVIGTMVDLLAVTQNGTPIPGPGLSSPAFDSKGNIYFLTAAQLFKMDAMMVPFTDFDTVLVRGNRTTGPAGELCYELELLVEPGDVFPGLNAGVDYQISFIGVATASGDDSPSAFWGNSMNGNAYGGGDVSTLAQDDPRTMTGIILAADITYDVDGVPPASDPTGSRFNDPTAGNGAPDSVDESYQVLLYVTPRNGIDGGSGCAFADITTTGSCVPGTGDGIIDLSDFSCYLSEWSVSSAFSDITLTGVCDVVAGGGDGTDLSDFSCYLAEWSNGCP